MSAWSDRYCCSPTAGFRAPATTTIARHTISAPVHYRETADRSECSPSPARRTGVTAACAALRRAVYDEVGGLSHTFPRSFNDVDLAFKLTSRGYRIIWTPFAELSHFESLTRDPTVAEIEVRNLYERWEMYMAHEPYARGIDQWWTSMPI